MILMYLSGTVGQKEVYKQKEVIEKLARHALNVGISGFTAFPAIGAWEGVVEKSYKIEIIGSTLEQVKKLAISMKKALEQESILITDGKKELFI